MDKFEFQEVIKDILEFSDYANKKFNDFKIWENKDENNIFTLVQYVYTLCILLKPFIPESIEKIEKTLNTKIEKFEYSIYTGKIQKPEIIFTKIEK
ncbi:class I tRNA ligase family protein [Patescibacteria group bacterium]|nr:class I tRNA ligase family protein [Patescibacteria group bacterium]